MSLPAILAPILIDKSSDAIEWFFREKLESGIEVDEVLTGTEFECELIAFIDENIDIPFVSDEYEPKVIGSVINIIKHIFLAVAKGDDNG